MKNYLPLLISFAFLSCDLDDYTPDAPSSTYSISLTA